MAAALSVASPTVAQATAFDLMLDMRRNGVEAAISNRVASYASSTGLQMVGQFAGSNTSTAVENVGEIRGFLQRTMDRATTYIDDAMHGRPLGPDPIAATYRDAVETTGRVIDNTVGFVVKPVADARDKMISIVTGAK